MTASRTSIRAARRVAAEPRSIMAELVRAGNALSQSGQEVINLGPGIPDYTAPAFLKQAAARAIKTGNNSYGDSRGLIELRTATADRFARQQGISYDPATEVTITAGASAALNAVLLAFLNPGDRVIVFEPFFENFIPQLALAGALPSFVPLKGPGFTFNTNDLARAFTRRTRMLLLNTPHNPSGRVFTRHELGVIADYCKRHDVLVVSDETYAPFVYDGEHVSIASLPGMIERTITIGSISKVLNVSGWRIGDVLCDASLSTPIRTVNDRFLGAAVPLQQACLTAFARYDAFTESAVANYRPARDRLHQALSTAGFNVRAAEGTFSIFADAAPLGFKSGMEACQALLDRCGIIAVPGEAFYRPTVATTAVRFCFARSAETLEQAAVRFRHLS